MATSYVLITGASKGIGKATALHLAGAGYHVFAGVRNPTDGEALQQATNGLLTPILIDVTKQAQISAAAEQIAQTVGASGLAGLINNAGVAVPAPLEFIPLDELRNQLEINVIGQIAVTQAVLPLIRRAQGRIINISSMGGRVAGPLVGAYSASKFALEALTDSLRLELHPWGIEVISIEPGVIATPIWETSMARGQEMLDNAPPQLREYYGAAIEKRIASAQRSKGKGAPPELVAATIAEALTTKRPRTRYLVGTDAKIVGNIIARLPDRLRDWIILNRS